MLREWNSLVSIFFYFNSTRQSHRISSTKQNYRTIERTTENNFITKLLNSFIQQFPSFVLFLRFPKKKGKKSLIKNYQSHPRYLNFSRIIDTIETTNYWQKKKKKLANNKWQFPFLPSSIISRRQPTPRQCPMKTKKMNGGGKRRREREGDLNGCCSFFGGRRLADLIHEVADTRSKGIRSRLETCLPSWAGMAWVSAGYSFEHPLPRNPVKFMIDCHERRLWVEPFRATEFFVNWTNIVSPPPPPPSSLSVRRISSTPDISIENRAAAREKRVWTWLYVAR